jgi:anti-sigma factor RsiW
MNMFEVVENWALHAFADGELEGTERQAMEKLLSENEEARKALVAINYQKSELRKAYGAVAEEPVPGSLLAAAQGRARRSAWPYAAMAASVALVMLGGVGGWFSALKSGAVQNISIAQRALVAHEVYASEQRHPVEVAADDRVHLQSWLSKRVGSRITIPTLDFNGYQLLGGRLLAGETSAAGQLMYETSDKQRLTIFVSSNPSGKDEELQWSWSNKLVTCFWREGNLALAVTGEMSKDEMAALAKQVYEQMEQKT